MDDTKIKAKPKNAIDPKLKTKKKIFKRNKSKKRWAIFARNNAGEYIALCEASFNMYWSKNHCCLFDSPPKAKNHVYFKPEEGHFILCKTKKYDDIQIGEYTGRKCNYYFTVKQGDNFVRIPDVK